MKLHLASLCSLTCVILTSCAVLPTDENVAGASNPLIQHGQLVDDRYDFYHRFCQKLEPKLHTEAGESCRDYIYPPPYATRDIAREEPRTTPSPPHTLLVFVSGILGECIKQYATPFKDGYKALEDLGYTVRVPDVSGRSSSESNAAQLNEQLRALVSVNDRVIIIGYSKGVADTMVALDRYRDEIWVQRTVAFVSVEGVVYGTPVADLEDETYKHWFAKMPFAGCPAGDGGGVTSLTTKDRQEWLRKHGLPSGIAYFSVAGVAQPGEVNPWLTDFYKTLSQFNLLNDGQVPVPSAVLPNSHLLAILKGDHWAIALPFNISQGAAKYLLGVNNAYPRPELIEAILEQVEITLAQSLAVSGGGGIRGQ